MGFVRLLTVILVVCATLAACARSGVLRPEYEYEEELYLALDGSAQLNVNASVAALAALRGAVEELLEAERRASDQGADSPLRRAYPPIPERVAEDTLDFDYGDPGPWGTPVDWNFRSRMLIHKLMRIAHEAGSDHYLLEMLEEERECVSAQLAFALADYDERVGKPTPKK